MNNKTICVTGAGGYIASYVVRDLLEKGYRVNGTVRSLSDKEKNAHLFEFKNASTNLKLFEAELSNEGSFDEATKDCHAVFNIASVFKMTAEDPQKEIVDVSVNGMKNVLRSCEKNNVKVVLILSSGLTYLFSGKPSTHVLTEEDFSDLDILKKINFWYAISKLLSEQVFLEWSKSESVKNKGIRAVSIAPALVVGPALGSSVNTSNQLFLSNLDGSKKLLTNSPPTLIDVRDLAKAHVLVLENEKASGRYLCTCGGFTWVEIANKLRKICPERADLIPTKVDLKENEVLKSAPLVSTKKIDALGQTYTDVDISLKDMIQSYFDQNLLKK